MAHLNPILVLPDQIIDFFILKIANRSEDELSHFFKQDLGYIQFTPFICKSVLSKIAFFLFFKLIYSILYRR